MSKKESHSKVNKSKFTVSPKLLQALKKVQEGGSISYTFLTERTRFTKEEPLGETYFDKSVLHCAINPEVFFKVQDGKKVRRHPIEVIQVFEDTKNDIGASYYRIG